MGIELPNRPIKKSELEEIRCEGCGATHSQSSCPYCGIKYQIFRTSSDALNKFLSEETEEKLF